MKVATSGNLDKGNPSVPHSLPFILLFRKPHEFRIIYFVLFHTLLLFQISFFLLRIRQVRSELMFLIVLRLQKLHVLKPTEISIFKF
jgi:hypothetical protein